MDEGSIVIGDSNQLSRNFIKDVLICGGFKVQAEAINTFELLRVCRSLYPDLVIIDSKLEGGNVKEIAGIIEGDNLGSVIFITRNNDATCFAQDYPHIIRPINPDVLLAVVEVSFYYQNKINAAKKEIDRLREELKTRQLVEKAKGILMKKYDMDEDQAHRWLQRESMNHGVAKREIARMLILANEKKQ
ncbi:ANTAR domain-containing protein [Thermosyntropha sp.]|uniref:ANTAR domain-containing response regulator n=1 Tax=Thermosyntropha sp. TaxID=2740820 RepID=UPI0025CCAC8D|nr:ANTAR domain-containing protein [Thermosyntropha sp.]MBO8159114.1 ANTAR domain-containing protein [Thermosyntropha sp.]